MMVAILVLLILNALLVVYLLLRKQPTTQNSESNLMLKSDLQQMSAQVEKLQEKLSGQLDLHMGRNQDSMARQLEQSAKLVANVTERLTKLDDTNRRVVDVADELRSLQNVLQNPKQRGVLGEFYLEQILQNMLPTTSYKLQHKLGEGLIVDAAIFIDGLVLPVDSKFSLENYNRLLDCSPEQRPGYEKAFKDDLKRRIDETAKYIQPRKGTMEYALMFIPSEAIYYDLLANKVGAGGVSGRDLMQYAAVDKHVTIVGPSTLSAMLQVILQSLRSFEIQKDTEVIRKNVEQLTRHLMAYDVHFKKVGTSLGATVTHYNNAYKELGKIDKDIVKIAGSESTVEPLYLDRPSIEDN